VFTACVVLGLAPAQAQTTWYVDDDCTPPGTGTQADPFCKIQDGIDAAAVGDEVVVADGTYTGTGNKELDFGGKAITVRSANGRQNCIIDAQESGRGFYFHSGEISDSRVEGFSIINGYSDWGGGIYCLQSSPTISKCRIAYCTAFDNPFPGYGGGIACYQSSPTIIGCRIAHCLATSGNMWSFGQGGGISCIESSPLIVDCSIKHNLSAGLELGGGGISCDVSSSPVIIRCTISHNSPGGITCLNDSNPSISECSVAENWAFGVYCKESSPTVNRCTIEYNDGSGIACDYNSSPTISGCTIAYNYVYREGGGIYCLESTATLANCSIIGNYCEIPTGRGGGLRCLDSALSITSCIIAQNGADMGAGIFTEGGSLQIRNSTIAYNEGGVVGGGIFGGSGSVEVRNSVLWGNWAVSGPQLYVQGTVSDPATLTVDYSDVEGGSAAVEIGDYTQLTWGDGNIDDDPLFVAPLAVDWHVSTGSPCIDAGDPDFVPDPEETDIDGEDRVVDGDGKSVVDMGADEFHDCNTNGLPDYLEIAGGTGQDTNENGIPDECEVLIVSASSCTDQGGTEWCLDLNGSNVEPRWARVSKLELQMNNPATAVGASVWCEVNSGFSTSETVTVDGTIVTILFDDPLPDRDCCTVTLSGDSDDSLSVRILVGDVGRDGEVTVSDKAMIKPVTGHSLTQANHYFDVSCDGLISLSDRAMLKPRIGRSAPSCP
jgi:hypothetical protein